MKSNVLSVIAGAGLVAISVAAHGADLPARPGYEAAPVAAVYNWTGIYLGANAGYGWGAQDPINMISNRFDTVTIGLSGGVFGATAGAQIQSGHVVIGIETDIDWANITGAGTRNPTVAGVALGVVGVTSNNTWESTARARVGYASNNWLFYATGGMALLGSETRLTTVAGGAVCGTILPNCTGTTRQIGAALGAGLEYGFAPNWSAKVEYLHITAVSLDVSNHGELRMGLNYRFGGM